MNNLNKIEEDDFIGEEQADENGTYRMIKGKKIYQIEQKTENDKELNQNINRVRASGMKPQEYLKSLMGKVNWAAVGK